MMSLVRKLVVLGFAVIQLVLVARILLDIGVIPPDIGLTDLVVQWSDVLAAPVQGIGGMFGGGGGGLGGLGEGLNPAMVGALVGWSLVEGLILMVVRKFEAV